MILPLHHLQQIYLIYDQNKNRYRLTSSNSPRSIRFNFNSTKDKREERISLLKNNSRTKFYQGNEENRLLLHE